MAIPDNNRYLHEMNKLTSLHVNNYTYIVFAFLSYVYFYFLTILLFIIIQCQSCVYHDLGPYTTQTNKYIIAWRYVQLKQIRLWNVVKFVFFLFFKFFFICVVSEMSMESPTRNSLKSGRAATLLRETRDNYYSSRVQQNVLNVSELQLKRKCSPNSSVVFNRVSSPTVVFNWLVVFPLSRIEYHVQFGNRIVLYRIIKKNNNNVLNKNNTFVLFSLLLFFFLHLQYVIPCRQLYLNFIVTCYLLAHESITGV